MKAPCLLLEVSTGKNTGVGCHAVLQGIFPAQESNPGVPHCRQILYHLSPQEAQIRERNVSFICKMCLYLSHI